MEGIWCWLHQEPHIVSLHHGSNKTSRQLQIVQVREKADKLFQVGEREDEFQTQDKLEVGGHQVLVAQGTAYCELE